jgi:uncharacterized membrane protein YqaE (UPF0057 family)
VHNALSLPGDCTRRVPQHLDACQDSSKETAMDCLRVVLSIIIPPVGVFLKVGFGLQFWINILLTLLGYIPGLVHAIWIIASR